MMDHGTQLLLNSDSNGPEPASTRKGNTQKAFKHLRKLLTPLPQSPFHLLFLMATSIFTVELILMLFLPMLPELSRSNIALLDSAALLLSLTPALYFFWHRPLMHHINERQKSENQIRLLSQQLMAAAEDERKRLALDLHDQFGQVLITLQWRLEILGKSLPPEYESQPGTFQELVEIAENLGDQVRNFTTLLRPEILDDFGIAPTLQWHVDELARQHPKINWDLRIIGVKNRPPAEVEIILYRLFQESLNNVLKHAQASRVEILLSCSFPKIILTVRDDGTGFDPRKKTIPTQGGGIRVGLLGMNERVASVGGTLSVVSQNGKGTVIRAELPLIPGGKNG